MEEKKLCLYKSATSVPATARFSLFAAGPERADEGGGPTPGRIEGNNVLRDYASRARASIDNDA
jgi:hypothetical protein